LYWQWKEVAILANEESIYWRIVLIRVSVLRAEITSGDIGPEIAEIDALLEEAAELIDESQQDKPSYYR
jgi:ARC6-like, IMS domain